MSEECISSCKPIYHIDVQDGVSFHIDNINGASFNFGDRLEDRELLAKYQGMVNTLDMLKDEIDDLDALWRDIIAGAGLTAISAAEVARLF